VRPDIYQVPPAEDQLNPKFENTCTLVVNTSFTEIIHGAIKRAQMCAHLEVSTRAAAGGAEDDGPRQQAGGHPAGPGGVPQDVPDRHPHGEESVAGVPLALGGEVGHQGAAGALERVVGQVQHPETCGSNEGLVNDHFWVYREGSVLVVYASVPLAFSGKAGTRGLVGTQCCSEAGSVTCGLGRVRA
jgi:hypothetical protein